MKINSNYLIYIEDHAHSDENFDQDVTFLFSILAITSPTCNHCLIIRMGSRDSININSHLRNTLMYEVKGDFNLLH